VTRENRQGAPKPHLDRPWRSTETSETSSKTEPQVRSLLSDGINAPGRWPLTIILCAYIVIAIVYGLVNPLFEAPDEPQHFMFINHLAGGHGLPVQGEGRSKEWAQEGSQPPLYYALAALVVAPLDTSNIDELLWFNPHVNMGVPLAEGNKNVYIHTKAEAFPFRRAALAVHLVRLLSTLMGVGTILATYHIAQLAFSDEPWVALGAAAVTAFTPQFVFISSAVNNDNLVMLCASWAIWAMLRLWTREISWRDGILIGATIGCAALSKLSGAALVGALALTAGLVWFKGRDWRALLGMGATAGIVAAAIAGWWFVRNIVLYGDPTGLNAMLDVFGRREVAPGLAGLLAEFEGLRISYWAIFGWLNILSWPPLYKLLDLLTIAAIAGLVYWLVIARAKLPEIQLAWLITTSGWAAILLVSLVRWTRMTSGTQGRLLFPGIAAMSSLFAVGITRWAPTARRRIVAMGLGAALLLWAVICPFAYIQPAYARPPLLNKRDIPESANPVHITYGDRFELIAYELNTSSVDVGETFYITTYWRSIKRTSRDYSIYVHLYGRGGEPIGQLDTYPGLGALPTGLWEPGQIIRDVYPVEVDPKAQAPTLAKIEIGPYLLDGGEEPLPMSDGDGRPLTSPSVARIRVAGGTAAPSAMDIPANIAYSGQIALTGYEVERTTVAPGEAIPISLQWSALRAPDADYTVFAHLVGPNNAIGGQWDSQPQGGDYPTGAWRQGDLIVDEIVVQVKPDATPGTYRLLVGFYQLETGLRLITDGEADYALLGEIMVSW
jgi:hypothetical protein